MLLCTKSNELVELNRFANSVKLNLFTLVELLLFSLRLPFPLEESFRLGIVVVDIEREGKAREFGRLVLDLC